MGIFNETSNFEDVFGLPDITTSEMQDAYRDFYNVYYEKENTCNSSPSDRIPYAIVNKLRKTVFSEYEAKLEQEKGAKTTKSDNINNLIDALDKAKDAAMQNSLIAGTCLIKPIAKDDEVIFTVIPRLNYVIFSKDETGNIKSCATSERVTEGIYFYTLFEKRTVDKDGWLTIENILYRSEYADNIGKKVELTSTDLYAHLEPTVVLPERLYNVGLIELRLPMENCIDGSDDGVSVYAAAVELIRDVYKLEAQLDVEFENAKSRIMVSEDFLDEDELKDTVFSTFEEPHGGIGITIYNPSIRDENFLNRKNNLLKACEDIIGLKRGLISEVEAIERTATEITSSEGSYNLTIIDLQNAWTEVARETIRTADILGQIYIKGWSNEEYGEIIFDYGDGVLFNSEQNWKDYKELASMGWLKPEYVVAKHLGLQLENDEDLERLKKYMPEEIVLT